MSENPYIPFTSSEAGSHVTKTASSWRTAVAHAVGAVAFCLGFLSAHFVWQIPAIQPVFGGPDPTKVILLLLALTCACGILSIYVVIDALCFRRLLRLLYAVPAAAFVAFMIKLFADMMA
ncbi:MAG: hypothetical protein ABGX07_10330 [Pirellulaceae bacterium]|nr:hypothetical protein [Fuerstiella sp.]HIK92364.1 hypothetical protein [Planctomycetota bacterium]